MIGQSDYFGFGFGFTTLYCAGRGETREMLPQSQNETVNSPNLFPCISNVSSENLVVHQDNIQ